MTRDSRDRQAHDGPFEDEGPGHGYEPGQGDRPPEASDEAGSGKAGPDEGAEAPLSDPLAVGLRDPETLDTEALGDAIATLAARIQAATYQLLVLIRHFDEREGWGGGFRSCSHWLSWRTGLAPGAAATGPGTPARAREMERAGRRRTPTDRGGMTQGAGSRRRGQSRGRPDLLPTVSRTSRTPKTLPTPETSLRRRPGEEEGRRNPSLRNGTIPAANLGKAPKGKPRRESPEGKAPEGRPRRESPEGKTPDRSREASARRGLVRAESRPYLGSQHPPSPSSGDHYARQPWTVPLLVRRTC
jgi:hypothetical protein